MCHNSKTEMTYPSALFRTNTELRRVLRSWHVRIRLCRHAAICSRRHRNRLIIAMMTNGEIPWGLSTRALIQILPEKPNPAYLIFLQHNVCICCARARTNTRLLTRPPWSRLNSTHGYYALYTNETAGTVISTLWSRLTRHISHSLSCGEVLRILDPNYRLSDMSMHRLSVRADMLLYRDWTFRYM
jgi:hypothetical protein